MTAILSPAAARAVTGGRNPFEIVPYTQAITALKECLTFDDTTHWKNFADAAEAWGKIHHSDEVIRLAKAVKLRAAARMAELAIALRGLRAAGSRGPGANAELKKHGMNSTDAAAAIKLAKNPELLERAAASKRPPGLSYLRSGAFSDNTWRALDAVLRFSEFAVGSRKITAKAAAAVAKPNKRRAEIVKRARGMRKWLDEFLVRV